MKGSVDPKKTEYHNLVMGYKEDLAKIEASNNKDYVMLKLLIVNSHYEKLKSRSPSYRASLNLLKK